MTSLPDSFEVTSKMQENNLDATLEAVIEALKEVEQIRDLRMKSEATAGAFYTTKTMEDMDLQQAGAGAMDVFPVLALSGVHSARVGRTPLRSADQNGSTTLSDPVRGQSWIAFTLVRWGTYSEIVPRSKRERRQR